MVETGLAGKSLESFLPLVSAMSKRRDRKVRIRIPLFPGYVFVKTDLSPNEYIEILKTFGVVRLVGNIDGPIPVPDESIDSLRIMLEGDQPIITGSRLKKGDRVMVIAGPFAGVVGTFVRYRGHQRVVVNIEALGRFAAVDIAEQDVEKLPLVGVKS